jgi:hypothetical protein
LLELHLLEQDVRVLQQERELVSEILGVAQQQCVSSDEDCSCYAEQVADPLLSALGAHRVAK